VDKFNHATISTKKPVYNPIKVIFQPGEKAKKYHRRKGKEKKQRKMLRTIRRDINALAERTKQLQKELQNLRGYDSEGFIILQRRR